MANGKALSAAIDESDCLIYGAMATAYEGMEDSGETQGCHNTRFRVIGDLLAEYRKRISGTLAEKAA